MSSRLSSIVFLVVVVLVGTVFNHPACPEGCRLAKRYFQCFRHVSEWNNSSLAPWSLERSKESESDLHSIEVAVCKECEDKDMVAKPITMEVSVYRRVRTGTEHWCRCPFHLPVGCTCVMKQ